MDKTILISLPIAELEAVIIDCVNSCLKYHKSNDSKLESDQILTIEQASEFLNLSKNTLYGYVQKSKIPVSKKGKRLYFSKLELLEWIKSGKKQTQSELNNEVDNFLTANSSKK